MNVAAALRKGLLLLPTVALAQQLTVTVLLREPLPGEISAWRQDPTIVRVVVSSSAPTPAYPDARIGFELRESPSGRLLARSKDGHPLQPRVSIPSGPMTVVFTGPEILHEEAVELVATDIRDRVAATGMLPEGTYEFCVRLLDAQLRPIAVTGSLCRTASVVLPDPPVLLTPADGSQLTTGTPLLSWTPVQPTLGPVQYRLRIVPIYDGQDRRSAIERNSPIYETVLSGTSLLYPPTAPPFALYPDATGFAWQVQALLPDGRPAARNQGKSQIFVFLPPVPTPSAEGGPPGTPSGGTPPGERSRPAGSPGLPDTVVTRVALPGGFLLQLETAVRCTTAPCTLSGRGKVYIPFLRDSVQFSFTTILVLPGRAGAPASLISGIVRSTEVRNLLLKSAPTAANHLLRILEWEFSPSTARVRARTVIDWSGTITCRAVDSIELGWQPIGLDGLPPIRVRIPTAWTCDGSGLFIGPCVSARFDSVMLYARFDTATAAFTGWLQVGGELTLECLEPPPSGRFLLRLDRGGADLLVTVLFRGRTAQLRPTPVRLRLDTVVVDLSSMLNPPGFPPAGLCSQSDWGNPAWRGVWIPGLTLSIPIESDTLRVYARNVIAEDIGGELKLSLSVVSTPRDTIHYAGFRVRVDSLEIRWCRGAFQSFTVSGLLRLPPTLSKPATWAQLDSLRLRLTCDASWNWLGTLDIFGGIQLDFGSYARLILHNGRIAKVAPSGPRRGYVEFTVIRLQAPPADTSSYVEFSGLRIWNNGDVELESAEGWINVSRWGNLTIAGITLQVQEVGLGYHQPSGNCSDSLKHWWVGFSGGVSIDAASGLPGGGSGVRVRRLRIYDNGCMQSEGAAINITVSGAFALRGELLWGTIRYGSGSGSGTVTASGILGQLSAAFYALGGFEAQVDFALGSVTTGTPYPFWFLQGAAVVPGGVPIVPGVFHLVGGIVGAGWRVRLDPIDTSLIRETAGIVPPPPLVPDSSRRLLLRGGLIFADPSLQLYRLSATVTVNLGSSSSGLLLSLDGNIRVLPTVRLAEGTASANISLPGGNLRGATIWLAGNVTVRLLVTEFRTGFSAHLNSDCFQFTLRNQWILVDLDHNIGIPVLGAQVVAKAYTSLDNLSLRVCPTSAAFAGRFSGAGVVGVKLSVARIGTVPFHFGLSFGAELCGYYLFRFSRSESGFFAETKLGGALRCTANADYSGWLHWGIWRGTQAYDHVQSYYCPHGHCGSGKWVDLSCHWSNCRQNDRCDRSVEDCEPRSIELQARGVFHARLTIPQTCFTDASGRRVCLPQWHSSSLSVDRGYYGYGRFDDKEGAKKGGELADEAENLSCTSLANEGSSWERSNAQEQQPPALVVWSTPGRGQTGIPIEQPLRLQLGAPVAPAWSAGGTGTCQWQLRNLNCQLYEVLPGGGLRDVNINVSSRGDSVVIRPQRQVSSVSVITTLMPNTRYRLIISGDWWAQCPGGSADGSRRTGAHDTLEFTTGAPSGWRFWVACLPFGRFRDTAMSSTPPGIVLWVVDFDQPLLLPLEFGRDLWLRVRDSRGRTWEWRGPTGGLIQSAERGTLFGVYAGHELTWDTLQLQPIVVADAPDEGFAVVANQVSFTILNAKKSGSTATRPDTADRLLDALPLEIDRWNWTRLPALAERSLQLSTQLSWQPVPVQQDEGVLRLNLRLRNTGARTIFAGTPFAVIVRKNIAGSVTEQRQSLLLPRALPSGGDYTFSVSLPAEPGLQGLSVWVLPRSPFTEAVPSDNCVEHGVPGDASCTPGAGVPAVQPE
jgi:hypothetical protein